MELILRILKISDFYSSHVIILLDIGVGGDNSGVVVRVCMCMCVISLFYFFLCEIFYSLFLW